MTGEKTVKYYKALINKVADLYVVDKLSIPKACARLGVTERTYYNACKKLGVESVRVAKDARVNFITDEEKQEYKKNEKEKVMQSDTTSSSN